MKHLGLFEGIGGFSLAARWMGWETLAWCEWNEFCQKVLRHHFPEAEGFGDITKTDFTKYANRIDILTGGFPCQPFSLAGDQQGDKDDRFMFPAMFRAIREIKPRWIVAENVYGLLTPKFTNTFESICAQMEIEGYEVQTVVVPASAIAAPHQRERVWIIAYSKGSIRHLSKGFKNREEKADVVGISRNGTFTNPKGFRQELTRNTRKRGTGFKDGNISNDFTNTHRNQRHEGRLFQEQPETSERYISPFDSWNCWNPWKDFPTQSPVCNGDDGIPRELDSITFSKWRNESIKSGGNAIVPQVALQIFKAIEQYELTLI